MKKPRHPVTDHAVIRYLERVEGLDVEALRREIGRKVDNALEEGASAALSGGFRYIIENGVVVTVALQNQPRRGHGGRT